MKQLAYNYKEKYIKRLFDEYFRYILIGILITCFDFILLAFQVEILHIYYLISVSISYILASILHFILCEKFVFTGKGKKQKLLNSFLIFFSIGIISLIILEICMFLFTQCLNIHYLISKVISTGFTFTFNFLCRKFILYN